MKIEEFISLRGEGLVWADWGGAVIRNYFIIIQVMSIA